MGSGPVRMADFFFVPKTRDNNKTDLEVAHLCGGSSSTIPGRIGSLEMLVFEERGKPEYPEKNLLEQRREPTTNSTHMWRSDQDLNLGHTGGRRLLSPLRHPCSPHLGARLLTF